MSDSDREKWDERYREGAYTDRTYPTALLSDWLPQLSRGIPPGRALDVACGAGRNALFLAGAGFEVTAIDISEEALARARQSARERGLKINWICADLESGEAGVLPDGPFDLVVMVRYVNMSWRPAGGSRRSTTSGALT